MADRKKPPPQTEGGTEAFLQWLEGVPDPRERYRQATVKLEKHQKAVELLSSVRAAAASDAYASGETVRALAKQLEVSPSRVHQLIQEAAKGRSAKVKGQKRRSSGRQKGDA